MSEIQEIKCPHCGHDRSGEWHDGQRICYYCGRHFKIEEEKAPDEVWTGPTKPVVVVWMRSHACNTAKEDKVVFPYKDGSYTFDGKDYPFTKYSGIEIQGEYCNFAGVRSMLTDEGFELHLQPSVAYDYSGVAWPEYLDIKIYIDNVPDREDEN